MSRLKVLLMLIFTIIFSACKTPKLMNNPPFKIISAEYEEWRGGIPGISGIKVQIVYSSNESIDFNQLYFKNMITQVEFDSSNQQTIIAHFDTSKRKDLPVIENDNHSKKLPEKIKFPFEILDNEAVISFKKNGQMYYYKVQNLVKIPSIKRK